MRVLHLLDQAGWQTCPTTLTLMAQALGRLGTRHQRVLLLGNAQLQHAAQQAGIDHPMRLGIPFGRGLLAWPALRRHVRRDRLAGLDLDDLDLVHCWSVATLTLAAVMWPRLPRALTLTRVPSRRAVHWLRVLCREAAGPTVLLANSATIRRALLTGGVPEQVVHVLRPGIDLGMVAHESRPALRRQWGLASDQVKLIALLGDPPHAADALCAVRMIMLAADAYPCARQPIRLLACPDQARRLGAERLLGGLGRAHWIICEARLAQPWQVLPGCDLALALGPHAGGLSLLWALAANVPVVGEATDAVGELVEDRHSALLAKPERITLLAHRVKQLIDDEQLAWRLKDAARNEVYSIFSRGHYCRSVQAVYDQIVAQQPVQVPPPAPYSRAIASNS